MGVLRGTNEHLRSSSDHRCSSDLLCTCHQSSSSDHSSCASDLRCTSSSVLCCPDDLCRSSVHLCCPDDHLCCPNDLRRNSSGSCKHWWRNSHRCRQELGWHSRCLGGP